MFSTFTGNSRRPRNVNLSGQVGNPFSNTSWSPSNVSNATKAVSDAQADREKRQAERQRLKAASTVQRVWRGHQGRQQAHNLRRKAFDGIYDTNQSHNIPSETVPVAFNLLISFFSPNHRDDVERLLRFVDTCEAVGLAGITSPNIFPSQISHFVRILVTALQFTVSNSSQLNSFRVLSLATEVIREQPKALVNSIDDYFTVLAKICQVRDAHPATLQTVLPAFSVALACSDPDVIPKSYHAVLFCFLSQAHLPLFESNLAEFSKHLDMATLASAVVDGYDTASKSYGTEELLWILCHFVCLQRVAAGTSNEFTSIEAIDKQLSALATEISLRVDARLPSEQSPESSNLNSDATDVQPLDPFIKDTLLSLVSQDAIFDLLKRLSQSFPCHRTIGLLKTSLFSAYISTLLFCFPSQADEVRMRLFMGSLPTLDDIPTITFLWQNVSGGSIFNIIASNPENALYFLRTFASADPGDFHNNSDQQEWPLILLFLEIYVFVLRLSDDEDFFSSMQPHLLGDSTPRSRTQACGLSIADLESLTIFLKYIAFNLYYHSDQLFSDEAELESAAASRLGLYLEAPSSHRPANSNAPTSINARTGLSGLKDIVTTAMKMLYERDSRKHFLPNHHWLMTHKLRTEDFIAAVMAEDELQAKEDEDDSEEEDETTIDGQPFSPVEFRGSSSMFANSRVSHNIRLERLRALQKQKQKERRMSLMGPKLEVLRHMPFVVPFETRVHLFRQFIKLDRIRRERAAPNSHFLPAAMSARHQADIRRGQLFEDAYESFYKLGDGLKDPISITFVDQFGAPEAGIDGGGVTKEFLTSVTKEAFSNEEGKLDLFSSSEHGLLYPNPIALDNVREMLRRQGFRDSDTESRDAITKLLRQYEFLGRIVGKCLYEGILVDLTFAGFFLLQWSSAGSTEGSTYKGSINDLIDMDRELYKGLLQLKNHPGDVSELGFDFTISDQISLPGEPSKTVTKNLVANGDKMLVTNDNRLLYISYVARHRLVQQSAPQTSAFLRGLRSIIRPSWLSMFNQSELQRLVGGDSSQIDLQDLRRNTVYSGLYEIGDDREEHPTIKIFWKVMEGFTDSQRRDVLKYVSSTPRAPLLGFSQLKPKFSIRDAGRDEERLPSTSTCVNLLKLPIYKTEARMREKLLYAITSGAGFDLS